MLPVESASKGTDESMDAFFHFHFFSFFFSPTLFTLIFVPINPSVLGLQLARLFFLKKLFSMTASHSMKHAAHH